MDPLSINEAFIDLNAAWLNDMQGLNDYCQAFGDALQCAGEEVARKLRMAGRQLPGNSPGTDTIMNWVDNLAWSSRLYHQVTSKWLTEYVVRAPDLDPDTRQRALFWVRQLLEMLAPANYFWTNKHAVQRFINTNSESLQHGLVNWLGDLQRGEGLPELTDSACFTVGKNLATTPGHVVYRNHLLEIIQYTPQTDATWNVPIVLIQPWINKYYIFDLTAQNSFIQYLVRQGYTVFVTSWKNPTAEMAHITFEDYMLQGALRAVTVARDICNCDRVHAAGYCIGGTLLGALMGWLAHEKGRQPLADVTLFATLLDFTAPGNLKAFVSHTSLGTVERLVAAKGVLDRHHLSLAFRMLNPSDLIWRNMINNYFYGEAPPRSDMLYWNGDSTSLPGAMCLFYLKAFYMENRMIRPNHLVLEGRPVDLKQVNLPIYSVGAQKDHICPWQATFQTCRLTAGTVRYVLATEGHITGIVNPPSPWSKKKFWAGTASRRSDAHRWLDKISPATGSWWPDWLEWLKPRSGCQKAPPAMGSERYRPIAPAPGTYVFE